jgi:hypothetical protein
MIHHPALKGDGVMKTFSVFKNLFAVMAFVLSACAPVAPPAVVTATNSPTQPSPVETAPPAAAKQIQPATAASASTVSATTQLSYPIVDTGQGKCYNANAESVCASSGSFVGQDGQYAGASPRYKDNGDGTVSDLVTGLMWQKDPGGKVTFAQATAGAASLKLGGYTDWRVPNIKELFSLILFDGTDVSSCVGGGACNATPFVDTTYFVFQYGSTANGERVIDAQFWSSTKYVGTTMGGDVTIFGVNFADGRIKGYPLMQPGNRGAGSAQFVRYARGSANYGVNKFLDNGNGVITDQATGLMWMKADSGKGMNWGDALAYCENLSANGYDDWRLPNAKELQSIVDYTRSPSTSGSAAIDSIFGVSAIKDEGGKTNYPFYWSSTTHTSSNGNGDWAVYVAFGEALGYMGSPNGGAKQLVDVHGAGAQRSDPKSGSVSPAYSQGHGPQGDVVRITHYARCARAGGVTFVSGGSPAASRPAVTLQSSGGAGSGAPQPGGGQQPPPTRPAGAPPPPRP